MVLSNEMVLIQQYANDRGPGWRVRGKTPEAETGLDSGSQKRCKLESPNLHRRLPGRL